MQEEEGGWNLGLGCLVEKGEDDLMTGSEHLLVFWM
jgi:hypothetical protein